MEFLQELLHVEESVMYCYKLLAKAEINNNKEYYNFILNEIKNFVNWEKEIITGFSYDELTLIYKNIKVEIGPKKRLMAIDAIDNAYFIRIANMIKPMLGEDLFLYEQHLRYDINQIILAFLSIIINDEKYQDIKEYLILYKYNLYFLNNLNEYDLIETDNALVIDLESKKDLTDDLFSSYFVDKTVLDLEQKELLDVLDNLEINECTNTLDYAYIIIIICEILSRLTLCDKEILDYMQPDFVNLLKDDELKEVVNDMLEILQQINKEFKLTRK